MYFIGVQLLSAGSDASPVTETVEATELQRGKIPIEPVLALYVSQQIVCTLGVKTE